MAERVFGGRYRVTGTLGHGGMASVYRAVDEQLGREVAVKVFRIGAVDHGERARAEAEIQTLAALRSPALVTLYDAALDDVDGDSYLVMELVPGSDLDTRLREGPLDTATTARVGAQVAEGLAAVHAQGIVHRDVKPANVLLESDGEHVKLADFGIALLRDAARVTGTGTVIGTAAYIAPEQVLGREISGQADVYALGLMLLQCLTGERPFPGTAVESATARLTRGPEIDQHLPTAWRTLLHVMTAQDPAERPTAAEAARRLRALERDGSAPATQLLPGAPGALTRAAGGAAGAAALGGAALGASGAGAASADEATQAMPTAAGPSAGGPDDATRAYDRTAPYGRPGQDDVATTVLGTQRGAAAGGAAAGGAAAGGAAAGGALAGAGGTGGSGTDRADSDAPKRRRGPIIAAVVVVLLVLAGIGIALFALGGDDGDTTPAPTESGQPSAPSEQQSSEPEQQPSQEQQQPSEPEQQPSEPEQQPSEPEQQPSEPEQQPSQPADDPSVGPEPGGPASNPVEAPQGGTGTGTGNNGNGNGPGSNSGKGKGAGALDTTTVDQTSGTTVGSLPGGPGAGPGQG
ncbi:serine/threonine-protein kinase [Curtobacterium caseinilyticum]|uniref:non-specific serine/threonine protein kinase n=1 Tax=Curtobacterium caseinilyticum TaxID=3055137 RepID=A0ABT7TSL9_9MICO|nr:serine/threonine-protein kinase [Curtobacterium caseinilyticum]MDM7892602.1 serine/threonine-protein kinase [Curtobacterium caseinilyticum]